MSFLLDPPLLVASGAAIERAPLDPRMRRMLAVGTVGAFIAVSAALYANAPGLRHIWGPFGARGGREFMLTSGLAAVDERRLRARHHMAALSLFALYPGWLGLGRRAARAR